jgi:hypothetical protein
MLNRIHTDESIQVLVFVVLPLLCLFIVGIILWIRSQPSTTASFPTFSVRVVRVSHEDAYVVYKDRECQVDFYAGPCDRSKACLFAPRELSEEELGKLVPNLDVGLKKLGFKEYEIARESGTSKSSSVLRSGQSRSNP